MSLDRPRSTIFFVAIAIGMILILATGGCRSRKNAPPTEVEEESPTTLPYAKGPELPFNHNDEVRFPRRLLFIQISHYTSLTPLSSGDPSQPDQTRVTANQLAQSLKVPTQKDNQVFLLSDTVANYSLPTREVVVDACERFFDSSKPHDRIIVYFGGHAIEMDGKAFIVPIEGDRNIPKALIPLQDFYSKLKACKATQKVVVWDVCRFNPDRGKPRSDSPAMTASLLKALTNAPEGVDVVVTCVPGERALEFTNLRTDPTASRFSGSAFLEGMKFVVEKNRMVGVKQLPDDPIPILEWIAAIGKRVAEVASSPEVGLKQTVRYYSDKDRKIDSAVANQTSPSKTPPTEVQAIVDEFRVPPLKNGKPAIVLTEYPYRDDVIAAYKADVSIEEIRKNKQKHEFRNVTLNAYQTIRDVWMGKSKGAGLQQRDSVTAPITNNLKNSIKKELDAWGIGIAKLEEANLELERVSKQKKSQPRRWQAHFDYARAIVKYRLAFMNEYDKLMGEVLTESLPPLDKSLNQSSYRLVFSEKMKSKKDVQRLAEEAVEAFDAVIAEYKDTPWAIQAKYEKSSPVGLLWQAGK